MKPFNELALFTGAGGGILGGKLLGWRTVCAVEIDPYARNVLLARQRDGMLEPFPIWDDVRTFDGKPWRGQIDVISGGFPCQDISAAGKGAGIDGPQSGLWREMARIICEVGPRFVFVENSPMLVSRGLGRVLGDLASLGYDAEWCVLGANESGAPHIRKRIWILAHTESFNGRTGFCESGQVGNRGQSAKCCGDVSNPNCVNDDNPGHGAVEIRGKRSKKAKISKCLSDTMCEGSQKWEGSPRERSHAAVAGNGMAHSQGFGYWSRGEVRDICSSDGRQGKPLLPIPPKPGRGTVEPGMGGMADGMATWLDGPWAIEPPDLPRVAKGVKNRVGRLKALGNGQVPQTMAMAWRMLIDRC